MASPGLGSARRALLVGLAAAVCATGLSASGLLDGPESTTVDARFAKRGAQKPDDVVVVAVDDVSIRRLGRWPFPRRLHARLVDRLGAAGPRTIVYDVQFTERTTERDDLALYDALGRAGGAVLATSVQSDDAGAEVFGGPGHVRDIHSVTAAADAPTDARGVIRTVGARAGDLPTVAGATVQRVLGEDSVPHGRQLIDYRGPPKTIPTYSFADVLEGHVPARAFRGKIIVVGATAPTLQDLHLTPVSATMTGPEVQANAIWTLVHGTPLRAAPGWLGLLLAFAFGLLPALVRVRASVRVALAATVGAGGGLVIGAQPAFAAGLLIPVVAPLVALILSALTVIVGGYLAEVRSRRQMAWLSARLQDEVEHRTAELRSTQLELIRRLARAAELRDTDTGLHLERMSLLCGHLGLAAGMEAEAARELRHASLLHDIGKIGIPDDVLRKPSELTDEQYALMRTHTEIGGAVLSGSPSALVQTAEVIARTHHERWDGSGYPAGLRGRAIPVEGRIAAICDVFDALVSARPYKPAWTEDEALAELRRQSGLLFDPELVEIFAGVVPRVRDELNALGDRHTAVPAVLV